MLRILYGNLNIHKLIDILQEKLEDTKEIIRSGKSKDRQYNDQIKRTKGQAAMIYKTKD